MMIKSKINSIILSKISWLVVFCLIVLFLHSIEYEVEFKGNLSSETLDLLKAASQLETLKKNPPTTLSGLKRRAEKDVGNLITALHSLALYNAHVELDYEVESKPAKVLVLIEPGEPYPLKSIEIIYTDLAEHGHPGITEDCFSEYINWDATPKLMKNIEIALLELLDESGYPFAVCSKIDATADQTEKQVAFKLYVRTNGKMLFGPVEIVGNQSVKRKYFFKKLSWRQGAIYSPCQLEKTQKSLEQSGLFCYVDFILPETAPEDGEIPIKIQVKEAKMRSIGLGLAYATQRGPGITGEWEHRNYRGMGEILNLRATFFKETHLAKLSYLIPDYFRPNENLVYQLEASKDETKGYTATYGSALLRIDTLHSCCFKTSYGIQFKHLRDTNIHEAENHQKQKHKNEEFNLGKFPLTLSYTTTDDLLDPKNGYALHIECIPSWEITGSEFVYGINILSLSAYLPLRKNRLTFAMQGVFGSIIGAAKKTIPRSELFDAGGDSLLRGYHYKTVSPLDNENDPTGGRSMMIFSSELRFKSSETFGWVLFHDFGNVYSTSFPDFRYHLLNSVGFGIRYYTAVGPIRLDIAFPLEPRKGLDSAFQLYLNIGQSF